MIKVFNTLSEYYTYINGGLNSGDIYFVKEDESAHFQTNNIDGNLTVYDYKPGESGSVEPELMDVSFAENGVYNPDYFEVYGFGSVTVSVPIPDGYLVPSGTLSISANGNADVTNYASVAVSVPVPDGYLIPSGNLSISTNSSSIDVTQYESVSVSVPASAVVSGTKTITSNGTGIDVTNYASVDVSVSGGGGGAPQWETVQADASGNAYVPCAHEDVIYISSTVGIFPNMYLDSSKNPVLETYMGSQAPVGPQDETSNLYKAYVLCVIPTDTNYDSDFETVAYAFISTTPNATIRYKIMSL